MFKASLFCNFLYILFQTKFKFLRLVWLTARCQLIFWMYKHILERLRRFLCIYACVNYIFWPSREIEPNKLFKLRASINLNCDTKKQSMAYIKTVKSGVSDFKNLESLENVRIIFASFNREVLTRKFTWWAFEV